MNKLFPKCKVGRAPLITYHGYLVPCCWVQYRDVLSFTDGKKRLSPFFNSNFDLNKHSIGEILESDHWVNMINGLIDQTPNMCQKKCNSFIEFNGKALSCSSETPKYIEGQYSKQDWYKSKSTDNEVFEASIIKPIEVSKLNIETSTRCSLRCPYCSRTKHKGKYPNTDLPLSILENSLMYKSWDRVHDCAGYNDPTFYKHYYAMLDIVEKSSIKLYHCSVAATGKGLDWWKTTVQKYVNIQASGTKVLVTFGIDGLEDTSKLHRIGQDWNEITAAMRMCIENDIDTIWQFIPFSHNEHQYDEVVRLAKEWGTTLNVVLSDRIKPNDPFLPTNNNLIAQG